jgi:RNA ligase (TIGR02306 family)
MEAVQIVIIKEKIPLFKGEEQANSIELLTIEEFGYELVSQKDIYKVGDKAVLIFPDYCVSDIPLFESFIRPNGDESKSMLGKTNGLPRRIRAKKFNLHRGDGFPVYSNGILLQYKEVQDYTGMTAHGHNLPLTTLDLAQELGITKYEEPDDKSGAGIKGGASTKFPDGVVKTDEENFNNVVKHFEKILPKRLIGRVKIDGSSITEWYKDGKKGIASRNQGKPLSTKKVTGRRNKTFLEKVLFWTKPDLNFYEEVPNDSDFVKHGMKYLDLLESYCKKNNVNIVLQGEIYGQNMKGSGNKNNPHAKLPVGIKFFNVCKYEDQSIKLGEEEFKRITTELNVPITDLVFDKTFNTIEEIKEECETYFRDNMVEGIVIRDENHNFSCKYMSLGYDAKK